MPYLVRVARAERQSLDADALQSTVSAPAQPDYRGVVVRLAEVYRDHVGLHAVAPNMGIRSPSSAAWMSSEANTDARGSTNSHMYSELKTAVGSERFSSSRKAGEIRDTSSAGMRERCQGSSPDHASQNHPRRPHGVLRAIRRPPVTANIGRTAEYNSSSTRAASSMMSRSALNPRTVASVPGRLRILEPFANRTDSAPLARKRRWIREPVEKRTHAGEQFGGLSLSGTQEQDRARSAIDRFVECSGRGNGGLARLSGCQQERARRTCPEEGLLPWVRNETASSHEPRWAQSNRQVVGDAHRSTSESAPASAARCLGPRVEGLHDDRSYLCPFGGQHDIDRHV